MPPAYNLLDGDGRLKNAATAARARLPLLAGGCCLALLLLGLLSLSGRGGQPALSAGQGTLDTAYPARPFAAAKSHSATPFALADLFDKGFIASLDDQLRRWAASREGVVNTRLGLLQYRRIFQVGREAQLDEHQRTFVELNPGWRYEYMRDGGMEDYVASTFAQVPAIVAIYRAFPQMVIRTDWFRLLVLYAEGGLYSDLDTRCLKPIDEWRLEADLMRSPDVDALIGVEIDVPDWSDAKLVEWRMVARFQVVQWTILSRPHSALLRRAIVEVAKRFLERAQSAGHGPSFDSLQHVAVKDTEILQLSGPAMLTAVVEEQARADLGRPAYNLTELHGLQEPRLVGRTLVLPVT